MATVPKRIYVPKAFHGKSLDTIQKAEQVCNAYARQGLVLTLRQLYYQFVSRGWIANRDTEYKRLGSIINDARLAGLLDWNHLEDRTRNLRSLSHWESPSHIVQAVAAQYTHDLWNTQPAHVEVWIEKDALVGVIERVCARNDVGYFSCRGYTSQSEVWGAAQRLGTAWAQKRRVARETGGRAKVVILHLGDHDPSGIDMTRDIDDRLHMFMGKDYYGSTADLEIRRLALNMDQVEQYSPPPNPAKLTDSRATGYIDLHGDESWELDALEPTVIVDLIQSNIDSVRDAGLWRESLRERDRQRAILGRISERWDDVEATYGADLDGVEDTDTTEEEEDE